MNDIEFGVCKIVAHFAGMRAVTPCQRLYHDLKLTGDDAVELLEALHAKFGTAFTDFQFAEYFPNEGEAAVDGVERLLGFAEPRKPLTIGHLSEVVRRGAWFEPEADQSRVS